MFLIIIFRENLLTWNEQYLKTLLKSIYTDIKNTAKKTIPKGQQEKYRLFWTKDLNDKKSVAMCTQGKNWSKQKR